MITNVLELNLSPLAEKTLRSFNKGELIAYTPIRSYAMLQNLARLYREINLRGVWEEDDLTREQKEIKFLFETIVESDCLYVRLRSKFYWEQDDHAYEFRYGSGILEEREESVEEYLNRVGDLEIESGDVEW